MTLHHSDQFSECPQVLLVLVTLHFCGDSKSKSLKIGESCKNNDKKSWSFSLEKAEETFLSRKWGGKWGFSQGHKYIYYILNMNHTGQQYIRANSFSTFKMLNVQFLPAANVKYSQCQCWSSHHCNRLSHLQIMQNHQASQFLSVSF